MKYKVEVSIYKELKKMDGDGVHVKYTLKQYISIKTFLIQDTTEQETNLEEVMYMVEIKHLIKDCGTENPIKVK